MTSLVDTLLWLCSIPSPTGSEVTLCDALVTRLGERPDWHMTRYGNSLVASRPALPGRPHVVLAGHLDTVVAHHDGPPRVEGDRLYGAGASDMKAGLALMIEALESGFADTLDMTRTFVWYAGEEDPFEDNELQTVLKQAPEFLNSNVDLAVCLEPSDNEIQVGCMGTMHANVVFEGVSAHSGRPWHGTNALYAAIPMLQRLALMRFEPVDVQGMPYTPVLTATMAHGGSRRNMIPNRFEVNVNARFEPGTTLAQARARIHELVQGEGSVTIVDEAPSAFPHRDHWALQTLLEAGAGEVAPKQAWTDVAQFDHAGIPAVNFGPGLHAQAHQKNEWASIELLERGHDILHTWLGNVAKLSSADLVHLRAGQT